MTVKNALVMLALGSILTSIAHAQQDDVDIYLALTAADKSPDLRILSPFSAVFENMVGVDLEKRIKDAYAEKLYFNDTLVTLHTRAELIDYLKDTGKKANYVRTTILDVAQSGDDFYVKWLLEMEFEVLGTNRVSRTAGISHLRFDEHGRITVHKDFWDSANGLYKHMPVIGGLIKWIQRRFHSAGDSADTTASDNSRSAFAGE